MLLFSWLLLPKLVLQTERCSSPAPTNSEPIGIFDAVIAPRLCYAAGHKPCHQANLHSINVEFCRVLRPVVGLGADITWDAPWPRVVHV